MLYYSCWLATNDLIIIDLTIRFKIKQRIFDTKFQRDIYYRHASGSIAEAFFIHKNRESDYFNSLFYFINWLS